MSSSLYERLSRRAWRSGDFRCNGLDEKRSLREDGEALRAFIRSRMEWIVERCALRRGSAPAAGFLRLAAHARFHEEPEGGLLLDVRGEKAWRLSAAAAAVLKEISLGVSEEGLFSRLRERFSGEPGRVEMEARSFLAELRERGCLEILPISKK